MSVVAAWLSRMFDSQGKARPSSSAPEVGAAEPPASPASPPGFAEAPLRAGFEPLAGSSLPDSAPMEDLGPVRPEAVPTPFVSTGPHGHRGRMREKLLERGPDALADYELLEMLLFFAFKQGDTKPLAKSLINQFGSFAGVLAAPQKVLLETRGLGPHSVAAIKLVQAAALRLARAEVMEAPVLNNWDRLITYLNAAISREKIEQFRILFLDSKNRLIADEPQAKGTVNHTPVYPREVMKRALELHATALILVHNHPSGDPTPSRADVEMTKEIKQAATFFAVVVHDHLIVGNGRYFSFRREGLL